jgi:hypothetical protein
LNFSLLPRSLAGRTILILLVGFAFIQLLGLIIYLLNQINLARIEEEQEIATRRKTAPPSCCGKPCPAATR